MGGHRSDWKWQFPYKKTILLMLSYEDKALKKFMGKLKYSPGKEL